MLLGTQDAFDACVQVVVDCSIAFLERKDFLMEKIANLQNVTASIPIMH